jgi:hypothetical protein
MTQLAPTLKPGDLKGYIFLDNDFLGSIFADSELLAHALPVLDGYRVIDTFTRLEFLRDVWDPRIRTLKEEFVDSDIFFPSINDHQYIFGMVKANALALSRIYALNKRPGASLVDLLLAGTLMLYPDAVLVTGNKKDFPSFLFDLVAVINYEQKDGNIRAISVVQFNAKKFKECEAALAKAKPRTTG